MIFETFELYFFSISGFYLSLQIVSTLYATQFL